MAAPGRYVQGDIGLIERVLADLIDNAIKFTPAGGKVPVTVAAEAGTTVTKVVDTGIGIPPSDLPNIFVRFYRVERQSFETDGTGHGLAIVKRAIEFHGGSIGAASEPGRGSTLWFGLPRRT